MAETEKKYHWLVRMHHRMRTTSFALLFVASSLHIAARDEGPLAWLLLILLLLVYPHVQWWRATHSGDGLKTEMTSLIVDSVLLGALSAGLGFPLWIAFSAMIGTLSNNAANKGWRGTLETILAFPVGVLIWIAACGFRFSPATDWPATLFCIFGLSIYLVLMGNIGYARNRALRQTRCELRLREQELLAANKTLLGNLREIAGLQQQLHEQANHDPLTNLYNRRYLDNALIHELARSRRKEQALSLIMIDIDHFKKINDRHGHQAGDEVLVELARILGQMARTYDVACRYGGEEFLLLLPGMPLATARERGEQLRAAFAAQQVPFADALLQTTISLGIATFPEHGDSPDQLIRHADYALYQAKHDGRNRVVVWTPELRGQ